MSIINQMLNDLEKRTKQMTEPDMLLSGLYSIKKTHFNDKKPVFLLWIIGFILLLALLFVSYKIHTVLHHKTNQSASAVVYTKEKQAMIHLPSKNQPTESISEKPVWMTGLTLEVLKEKTDLRLFLSQTVLYSLESHDQTLIMTLENTQLTAGLPSINTDNSAIKDIQVTNLMNGNLQIVMVLNPGSELTHLQLNESGKLAELEIDLSHKNRLATEVQHLQLNDAISQEEKKPVIKKIRYDLSIEDEYQQALYLASHHQSSDAIAKLHEILANDPYYPLARKLLVSLLMANENPLKAEQVLNTGLKQQPHNPDYLQLKAEMLVNQDKTSEALHLLSQSPPVIQSYPAYYAFMAALYQRAGKPQMAEALYKQLIQLQPDHSMWWLGLGVALDSMHQRTQALQAFIKANNMGDLSYELSQYVESRVRDLRDSKNG